MYTTFTMDSERPPSRPAVPSGHTANLEFATWVRQNQYHSLTDGAGLVWDVEIEVKQLPDPDDLHKSRWCIVVHLTADPVAEDFLKTGTLSPDSSSDLRLVELLEERKVPMVFKPIKHEGSTVEDIRSFLADCLPKLRDHLGTQTFHDLKRGRVAAVVRESRIFGANSIG